MWYNICMDKKYCKKCDETKDVSEFGKNRSRKDGLQLYCKNCQRKAVNQHYADNKQYYIDKARVRNDIISSENKKKVRDYLYENPCVDCGEGNFIVLEFDHVRGKKSWNVSEMMKFSWETILKEISKCEIRCANCHRIKTAKQLGWYRDK